MLMWLRAAFVIALVFGAIALSWLYFGDGAEVMTVTDQEIMNMTTSWAVVLVALGGALYYGSRTR